MTESRWIAIDVETANSYSRSICALGVAYVGSDGTTASRSWLVQPPGNRYDAEHSALHGLTADDTRKAPRFPEVWAQARKIAAGANVLAHNAEYDTRHVQAAMRHHKHREPVFKPLGCTLRMAHLVWPQRTASYGLAALCADVGIPHTPHDAASDAAAVLALARVMEAEWGRGDLHHLRAASNRGHEGRAQSAMSRVARHSTRAPSERQLELIARLVEERGLEAWMVARHIVTAGQASRLIDAIFAERTDWGFASYNPRRYERVLIPKLHRIIEEAPLPDAGDPNSNDPPTERQLSYLRALLVQRYITEQSIDNALAHVSTCSRASRLIDAILSGPSGGDFKSVHALKRYVRWLERTLELILDETAPPSDDRDPPAQPEDAVLTQPADVLVDSETEGPSAPPPSTHEGHAGRPSLFRRLRGRG